MIRLSIEYAFLIPLIPLAASLVILFGGKEDPHSPLPMVGISAMALCFVQSLVVFALALAEPDLIPYKAAWPWFSFAAEVGGQAFLFNMPASILIDGPAVVMLVVVTLVSLLVQI